jgi:hypothetical protein
LPHPQNKSGNNSRKRGNSSGTIRHFPAGIDEVRCSNVTTAFGWWSSVSGKGSDQKTVIPEDRLKEDTVYDLLPPPRRAQSKTKAVSSSSLHTQR